MSKGQIRGENMPESCFGTPAVKEALMQCDTGRTSHWAAVKGVYKKDMKKVCLSRTEGTACQVPVLSLSALVPTVTGYSAPCLRE